MEVNSKPVLDLQQSNKLWFSQTSSVITKERWVVRGSAAYFYNLNAFFPLLIPFLNSCCLCLVLSKLNGYLKSSMKIITKKVC